MSEFDLFADNLADEVLTEMADNFFGSRREMDEQIEVFNKLVRELAKLQAQVERFAEILHFVLLGEEGAAAFYESVGLDPATLPLCLECTIPPQMESVPFAFTKEGRFGKIVVHAYRNMCDCVEDYLHGHEYADPGEPRRKRISVHYLALQRREKLLNKQIEKLNSQSSVSCTLQYVRGLDPANLEREKIAGAPVCVDPLTMDAEFKYDMLDLDKEGLKNFPTMPPYRDVRREIAQFVQSFYARNREEITVMLARLQAASKRVKGSD